MFAETLPAVQELRQRGISFRIHVHSGPVTSLEQAALERGQIPDQVVRSILFRLSAGEYLMVLMPGPRQISWRRLRELLGVRRLTIATDEELLSATGYRPGTVTPFGLPNPLRLLADRSLFTQPEISLGSGQRGLALILTPDELLRALPNLEIADL